VVGYHTLFDVVMLDRAASAQLGIRYDPLSIDLGLVLPRLSGRADAAGWELDRWLEHYRIGIFSRHSALADAFATAQLFMLALQHAQRQGLRTLRDLLRVQVRQLELLQSRG
jgi:DNA polymerase-3 subunit epsilon